MIQIYHNPRCSKSRQTLEILEDKIKDIEIIKYLDSPPTVKNLKYIISLLGISPNELIRKNEAIWKEQYKGKKLSDKDIIHAMVKYPKLIERPIVINGNKAVIGRPPLVVLDIL
ncbi:MAG: arsenate reductase (glutaredoxin) [Bacteroidia bacterium]|nr:arsenate reductase (glutaredoxin) [Bacteroidia bacterium]